ncbi:MAG: hypothetical protein NTX48_17175, partial [Planctomycetales bacterium]|nr:hypothetical protein [Planctomycetales bacterium]
RHARWLTANATIARNAAKKSPPLTSAPQRIGEPERRWNEWVPRTLTHGRREMPNAAARYYTI